MTNVPGMTVRSALFASLTTLALTFASPANASTVLEAAGNGTFATAQSLDGYFSLDFNPDITDSTSRPHATLISGSYEDEYDYYSFTVATAGSFGIFDIDYGWNYGDSFDSFLTLLDGAGNVLSVNDDNFLGDSGSSPLDENVYGPLTFDSFLTYTFASAGTYFIRVGSCCYAPPSFNDFVGYPSNGSYQLHASLQNAAIAGVPEPSTWAMMLLGFGAIGFAMRRRQQLRAVIA